MKLLLLFVILVLLSVVECRRKGSNRGDFNNRPGMGGLGNSLGDFDDEEDGEKDEDAGGEEKEDEILSNRVEDRKTTTPKPTSTTAAKKEDEIGQFFYLKFFEAISSYLV